MYSNNDYRYYLEHQLLTSGGYLSHHGVMGMKWGIRRYQSYDTVPRKSGESGKETGLAKKKTKLENKKAKNSAKIKEYQDELAKPRTQKQIATAKKYQTKLDKVNSSYITRRAEKRLRKGKEVGTLGQIQLARKARYEDRLARNSKNSDALNAKIADLEYKNTKLDKKINKTNNKIIADKYLKTTLADIDKGYSSLTKELQTAAKKHPQNKEYYDQLQKEYDQTYKMDVATAKANAKARKRNGNNYGIDGPISIGSDKRKRR